MGVVAYLLFFFAGLGFGYAAVGRLKWLPIGFPIFLWIGAVLVNGVEVTVVLRLILALAVTAGGILLGMLLDSRQEGGTAAEAG